MHYQIRHTQGKLVRCVAGAVFDVAVDLRVSSAYFGKWVGRELSEENKHAMWIPPGFAHGFLTLSETADFHYKCSDIYDPQSERSICWDDPTIGINWPSVQEGGFSVTISEKDAQSGKLLVDADVFE